MEKMVIQKIAKPKPEFWKNKKVLLTGHSGFKGAWMSILLNSYNAEVCGISLEPITEPSLFNICNVSSKLENNFCDIRDLNRLSLIVKKFQPEIVIHMAALPLVRDSYLKPIETFETNVLGTVNLLESLRDLESVKSVLCITTDKVYKNKEQIDPYKEEDELGGYDPYSSSKAASEIAISCYRDSFLLKKNIGIASVRAGNVIGGGDWSSDRLIPDIIRAYNNNSSLEIRYPDAVRPWQHVLEPIFGYLILAENLFNDISYSDAYNFGPDSSDNVSVKSIINIAENLLQTINVNYLNQSDLLHEAGLLTLNNSKIKNKFDITPVWSYKTAVERTINWYKKLNEGCHPEKLCNDDIEFYNNTIINRNLNE